MKIYACYHKEAPVPESDVLTPIQVGKTKSSLSLPFISDDTMDNIAHKNPYYCELTAMYWIWKNVHEDIVGLCHYRRYFNFNTDDTKCFAINKKFATKYGNNLQNLTPVFEKYDIVLPSKKGAKRNPTTLYDYYKSAHYISDLDCVLDVIKEKYPHQYQTAYSVLHNETQGYYANMLMAKKPVFDAYAQWLFDILFEVEARIHQDVLSRDAYQQRVYGFLSERMMTVYMALHPELKVKEVPFIYVDQDKKGWFKYLLRSWKRKILKTFGFRKENRT